MITIIPAIDIIDGKCVRLTGGQFDKKKVYNEDPVEVALAFEALGLKRLHLVDLDGARTGTVRNWQVLERIASATNLVIDFGGGITNDDEVNRSFNVGASMINIGSMAVNNKPKLLTWLQAYGSNKFLIGADVKNELIMTRGWTEESGISIYEFIKDYMQENVRHFFCTDISKDGMMEGPSEVLYQNIIKSFPGLYLIASGGVSNIQDVEVLKSIGCKGVIIGKAFYEGTIKPSEIMNYVD